jgi:Arc/MetJ-type ribon-helix-helix transcriptional regulator
MVRPKKEGPKSVKRSVSIDPDLFKWINDKIKIKRFSTLSHAINEALLQMKKRMDEENN